MQTETKPKTSGEERWRQWLFAGGLMAATFIVYLPALHGEFIWDDDTHISKNAALLTFGGLRDIWFKPGATAQYYPLSFTFFWLAYHLWGLNTLGYHVLNVLLHGVASVLLWRVLKALKVPGAWLAGAIFALHPVCVMSVAWMTELKNTLSGGLALGSGWAYIRAAGLGEYERKESRLDWRYYVLSLVLFQLAIFAKTAVSFLPVTLGLVVWWQRKGWKWREIIPLLPMLGIAVGMGLVTIYVEHGSGGASGEAFRIPLVERVMISGRSFWFYLGKIFFPTQLTFIYERWSVNPLAWWQWLYPLATVGLLAGLWWKRKSVGKGLFTAGMHFYISTSLLILIVVLYMTKYSFVSDHWQYFGCMSVVALSAAGLTRWLEGLGKNRLLVEPALYTGLFLVLGILTWQQCGMYKDIETLWQTTIERNPKCWLADCNYGAMLIQKGRTNEAVEYLQKSIKGCPDFVEARNDLGNLYYDQGELDKAFEQFQEALKSDPGEPMLHYNLGNVLLKGGRVDEAVQQYREAINLSPDYVIARDRLGDVFSKTGREDEAIEQFQKSLEIQPDNFENHYLLGNLLSQKGRTNEAIIQYDTAVRLKPDFAKAHNNLGTLLLQNGSVAEAIPHLERVAEILPENPMVQCNLGEALLRNQRIGEAIMHFQKALQLQPTLAPAQNNLARIAWRMATSPDAPARDGKEAVELCEQLARLSSESPLFRMALAAAYAEVGRFADASATAEQARQLAAQQNNTSMVNALDEQLALYRAGKPFHEAASATNLPIR